MTGQLVMLNSEIPGIRSGRSPFYNERLSRSYAHFFTMAHAAGEHLRFASAEDFLGDGSIEGHWIPTPEGWRPVAEPLPVGLVFDKLGGDDALFNATIERLIELEIPIFGHYGLNRFTGDKWVCYEAFPEQHALSRAIHPDRSTVEDQIDAFFELMDRVYEQHDDLAVIKPRWGWESRGLYLLQRGDRGVRLLTLDGQPIFDAGHIQHVLGQLVAHPYIIQAWVDTRAGIPELGFPVDRHDARFVFSIAKGQVARFLQAYVKTPQKMFYFPVESFPEGAFAVLEPVASEIARRFPYGIFSVDLMRDYSGRWFLTELNDQVGFNIDFDSPRDIQGVSQLMGCYLAELRALRDHPRDPRYASPI